MVKLFVWGSLIFLLGGIAAITFLTVAGNYKSAGSAPELRVNRYKYVNKNENGIAYSIKQLDSLTAADNLYFTKPNAYNYSLKIYK